MKKFILLAGLMFLFGQTYSQTVPRNMVILEISTGTWCTYCPGAANAADQLVAEGKSVAVIEYHNGDAFVNTASDSRNSYYNITGYPTGHFDGPVVMVGGAACPSGNVYGSYLPLYTQQINTPSPLSICFTGSNVGNNYTVNITVTKIGTVSGTSLRLHLVLTESDIATAPWPGSGGCMNEVNFVERLMVPDYYGTSFNFGSGNVQTFTLNFTKDASWVAANCEVVAFVQDNATKTIYNGAKCALTGLPTTAITLTDFTGTPTSGCAPLQVSYSAVGTGITQYDWSFPGGNPATSTQANPVVTYSTPGTYNVSLEASNGVCKDSLGKTGYITIYGAAGVPGTPQGLTGMCVDPSSNTYTTTGTPYATSYTWDLTPAAAGVLTNYGTSCTIDWDNTWTGTAQLKVQGSNANCGTGPWSAATTITIDNPPPQPGAPSGPGQLCMNPDDTQYTSTGASGATSYQWDLTPSTAGNVSWTGTSATVYWSDTYVGNAQLKLSAFTNGCQGPWSETLDITIAEGPQAFNMTGGGTYCGTSGIGLEVGLDGSQTGVDYTLYFNGSPTTTIVPGTGSAITFGSQAGAGDYTARGEGTATTCTNMMTGTATVEVDPQVPDVPGTPTGPGEVYSGSNPTSDYVTTGGQYATSYSWELSPAGAGTISGTSTTGTATWDPAYEGPATVTVQGMNTCGGGSFSTEFSVEVHPGFVGIGDDGKNRFFSVHPNPVKGILTISSSEPKVADITVISPLGKTVLTRGGQTIGTSYQLDLTGLAAGVYTLSLRNEGTRETIKIVVK